MFRITRTAQGAANFGPWEIVVRVMILVWFVLYTLNAIPDVHPLVARVCGKTSQWIGWFFVGEYLLRVLCAKPRLKYMFSFMGLLDFVVCLPMLSLFFGADLQELYSLRIVRVLAIFKLARFNETVANFRKAFSLIRDELIFFTAVILFMLYVTALGIYMVENEAQPEKFKSFLDGLWFAAETLSTVGYGDLVPVTAMGRLFTGVILFIAVSFIAVSTGLVTSAFSRVWQQDAIFPTRRRRTTNKTVQAGNGQHPSTSGVPSQPTEESPVNKESPDSLLPVSSINGSAQIP